ncbi:MAG: hypothetical protein D3906_05330 [Candidatus Electrothrix sp. AUS1_2]|nr:hypothetical protein [Candidatus Electrothrix sp. AUS1_2]
MKNRVKFRSSERIAWFLLFIVLILAGIARYRLLDVPFERDEGEYAYAGQMILQGVPPYQEVYNMKFPGIYAAYALSLAMFGESHQSIHTALLIINAITIITLFLLAKHIANLLCAVTSAASFALLSLGQPVQGVFANAEHFVIVFVTGGLLFLLQGLAATNLFRLAAAGIFLGLGCLMKQHGFAFSILAVLYIIFDSLRQNSTSWRSLLIRLLAFLTGISIVFFLLFLSMFLAGVFTTFRFWTIDYALAYVSQVPLADAWQGFISTFMRIERSAPLLWILVGCGFFPLATKNIAKHHRVFLLMYVIFSLLSICPGFYFRPHYFVLLLPCAALFTGGAISTFADFLSNFFSQKIQYGVSIFLLVFCLCQAIYQQRDFIFRMTPFQISRSTYGPNPFPESIKIAEFIQKNTRREDRIAILGSEPQIFFYSKRRSATGYIYMYPLMENHDFALQMQKN